MSLPDLQTLIERWDADSRPPSERTEKQIKEVQEKLEKKKAEIIQIQAAVQSASQGQGQPGQVAAQG